MFPRNSKIIRTYNTPWQHDYSWNIINYNASYRQYSALLVLQMWNSNHNATDDLCRFCCTDLPLGPTVDSKLLSNSSDMMVLFRARWNVSNLVDNDPRVAGFRLAYRQGKTILESSMCSTVWSVTLDFMCSTVWSVTLDYVQYCLKCYSWLSYAVLSLS